MDLGKSKGITTTALMLAFFDTNGFIDSAPEAPVIAWSVDTASGATITPSADGLSAVVTPKQPGTVTIAVQVSGTNFAPAADTATIEFSSGAPVSVKIQLQPVPVPVVAG